MKMYHLLLLLFLVASPLFAQEYQTGCLVDEDKYQAISLAAPFTTRSFSRLPTAVSLKKYAPTPKHQGPQGSCVGWATSYAARSILQNIRNGTTDKSKQVAFSPAYIYNQVKLGERNNCVKGSYIEDALEVLQKQGTLPSSEFPYIDENCADKPNKSQKQQAAQYRIHAFERVFDRNNDMLRNINTIKKSLSDQKPVIIGFKCYDSFQNKMIAQEIWAGTVDFYRGGHAMTIVGYDDNKHGGAFEIMNSWGTEWGKNGFVWVHYEVLIQHLLAAFEMSLAPKPAEMQTFEAAMQIIDESENDMPVRLATNACRDFDVVQVDKSTYEMAKPYSSGTRFRIAVNTEQEAYIYILGFGSKTKKVSQIYPFKHYSAHFPTSFAEISIPDEEHFIALDDNVGKDYLCLLYSSKPLDIVDIVAKLQAESGYLPTRLKKVLKTDMLKGENIVFERERIAFSAKTKDKSIVPVVVEFEHIE